MEGGLTVAPGTTPSLFGHELRRVGSLHIGKKVEVENTSEAKYCVDGDGLKWVGKGYVDTGVESILAEAISWPIAKELGVKTPSAAVYGKLADDSFMWLSEYVPGSLHWKSEHAAFIANAEEFGAMLALDVVVLNEDRHAKNILLTPGTGRESELTTWSIDVGNAVVGSPADLALRVDDVPSTRNLAKGIPTRILRAGAMAAAARAKALASTPLLGQYVAAACALVDEPKGADILASLQKRMSNAEALVARYLSAIEGLT